MAKRDFVVAGNDFFKEDRSAEHAITDWGPSLTRQEFADEADINVLMSRYEYTGVIPVVGGVPTYVDWTEQPSDLMSAMEIMHRAEEAFMSLPAKVRKEFDNNAVDFADFAADPENLEQMRAWGLAPPVELPDADKSKGGSQLPAPPSPPQEAPKAS